MELLWEIAGWAGAAAILSAYLAVSMGWLKAGKGFQTANLIGAVAFIINGTFHGAWPSVVTNVAWFLISAVALVRMRSESTPPVVAADPQVQFPGVPDTTGQMAVVEVLTGSMPVVSMPAVSMPAMADGQRLAH
ncbi:hypothetical protein ACFVGV_03360 [Pseudarthrobacter scleromae]|uniref:CBU_0592 family membrane protein n=1 Tax=Pseudarthrobacter scleromae TaxID=158897 RepID=UPI0036344DF0